MVKPIIAGVVLFAASTMLGSSLPACAAQPAKGDKIVLQDRQIRNYDRPRQNGNRLAFCTAAGECGKPAADDFCRSNGFEGAMTFQRDRLEGHSAQLRFLRIKCWRSKHNNTPQPQVPVETGSKLISNTSAKSNRR
jgi:hypothetical protein